MICKKCSAQVEDDALFCQVCGTRVEKNEEIEENKDAITETEEITEPEEEVQPVGMTETVEEMVGTEPKEEVQPVGMEEPVEATPMDLTETKAQTSRLTRYLTLGVCAILLIVVLVLGTKTVLSILTAPKTYGKEAVSVWTDEGEKITYIYDGQNKIMEICDEKISTVAYNMDNTVIAFLSESALYVVDHMNAPEMIEEDVIGFQMSCDGSTIAYVVEDEQPYGDLYVYSVKSKNSVSIASEVLSTGLALSTDGKQIAYKGDYDKGDSILFFGKVGGKISEVEENASPIAIGKGKLVFANDDSKIYLYDGKNSEKIESSFDSSYIRMNSDHSEMLYIRNGSAYYYKIGAKDSNKLIKDATSVNVVGISNLQSHTTVSDVNYRISTINVSSFKNQLLSTGDAIYLIDSKCEDATQVADDYDSARVNAKTKDILLRDGNRIKMIHNYPKNTQDVKIATVKNLNYITYSEDYKHIYALDDDGELSYIKRRGKNEADVIEIADDVTKMSYCESLKAVVYLEEDELFFAKQKAKSDVKIADDVNRFWISSGKLFYEITDDKDDYELFTVDSKGNPVKLN